MKKAHIYMQRKRNWIPRVWVKNRIIIQLEIESEFRSDTLGYAHIASAVVWAVDSDVLKIGLSQISDISDQSCGKLRQSCRQLRQSCWTLSSSNECEAPKIPTRVFIVCVYARAYSRFPFPWVIALSSFLQFILLLITQPPTVYFPILGHVCFVAKRRKS